MLIDRLQGSFHCTDLEIGLFDAEFHALFDGVILKIDILQFFKKETLEALGFRVLPHPLYSPDLAPSDFHLFRSLQWFLRDKTLEIEEEVKSALDEFFTSKDINF